MSITDPTSIDDLVRRSAGRRSDALALVDAPNRPEFFHGDPIRLTWAGVDAAVDNLGASLDDLGVRPGDSVAIQLPNTVELVLTILACARLGAVAVPFPIQHRQHELRSGLAAAGFRVMVTAERPDRPSQLADVSEVLGTVPGHQLAVFGPGGTGAAPLVINQSTGAEHVGHRSSADDVATICWTSGTTGTPKGVPRTNSMWFASSRYQVDQLRITADDRILCPFPVVNMAGIGGMLLPWVMTGAMLALHQPLDLPVFLGQLQSEAITYTVAPPPLLNMLLRNETLLDSTDLSNIRTISSGSAPLDGWMVAGWQDRGIEIVNVFGSNEGAAMLSTLSGVPDPHERASFFPVPERDGVEVRLVDPVDERVITDVGEPGELRFGGPTVFDGYLGSTGEEFDAEGYYRTGDIFEYVGDHVPPRLLRFVDRAKDIIIRGGMNISAAELEGLIGQYADVVECAVVGYPGGDLGERVGVFVVPAEGASPALADIVAHLRGADVASYKLPERVEIVDALPRNAVGKVTKPELRSRWQQPSTIEDTPGEASQ